MADISGFGIRYVIRATKTYPNGYECSHVADDSDPLDIPSIQIADKAMTMNGELLTWSKANPLLITLAVVPDSDDDVALEYLAEANRPTWGKQPARDVVTLIAYYPNGDVRTLSQGAITDAMLGSSVSSDGRLKTKTYQFAFTNLSTSRVGGR